MSEDDSLEPPADTMWERAGESRLKVRLLISSNRWLVVVGLSLLGYLLLVLLAVVGPSNVQPIATGQAVSSVFGSIIIAVVTSVTLVLTVAQLVLSAQIDELKDQRKNLKGEVEFRDEIEELTEVDVSPVQPNQFFRLLLAAVEERAETLRYAVEASGREDELQDVLTYADELIEHSRSTSEDLKDAEFGSFSVLLPVLHFNYAWKIHAARALGSQHDLPPEAADTLEDLVDVLRHFAPTREYFKSHYFQWEIVNTARSTLYGAMPALSVAAYMVLVFDATAVSGEVFGVSQVYLLVCAIYVVVLLPFTILLAYLLRILTVVKRTLDIGPFILRASDADEVTADVK